MSVELVPAPIRSTFFFSQQEDDIDQMFQKTNLVFIVGRPPVAFAMFDSIRPSSFPLFQSRNVGYASSVIVPTSYNDGIKNLFNKYVVSSPQRLSAYVDVFYISSFASLTPRLRSRLDFPFAAVLPNSFYSSIEVSAWAKLCKPCSFNDIVIQYIVKNKIWGSGWPRLPFQLNQRRWHIIFKSFITGTFGSKNMEFLKNRHTLVERI
jgi:hypothetical protein